MKFSKIIGAIGLILGIIGTIIEFATHDLMCKYGMNPLCFFWALKWAFLGVMWWVASGIPDNE